MMRNRLGKNHDVKNRRLLWALFYIYLLFLVWAILWKFNPPYVGDGSLRSINLHAFRENTIPEMRFNVLIFVPFGFYLSALLPRWSAVRRAVVLFLSSLLLEALQYLWAIGYSDVTDLILNTLGGVMGMVFFWILTHVFGRHSHRATTVVGVGITAFVLALSGFFLLGRIRIV